MVSPLNSIAANLTAPPTAASRIGDMISKSRQQEANLQTQGLQNQLLQQRVDQGNQAPQLSPEQSLGAARYLNQLGKQLLSVDESQWSQILQPNTPQLTQLGYSPQQLQGMTREQIQGVVSQTEPLVDTGFNRQGAGTANMQDFEFYNDLKKRDPEGASMFAKDVGLIPKDEKLSGTAEKALITAQEDFMRSTTKAREYELLADDYDRFKDDLPTGASATIGEFIKSLGGTQDEQTELRRRFQTVRLSQALKNLPPGPATDKDVAEAMKGVPKENASVEQVTSFLRGSAKIEAIESEFQEFKAEYISSNNNTKGLLKAWKEAAKNGEVESLNALKAAPNEQDEAAKLRAELGL